jgi:hypothetical protein
VVVTLHPIGITYLLLTQVTKSDLTPDVWPLGLVRVEWCLIGYQFKGSGR